MNRILIVDDERGIRQVVRLAFSRIPSIEIVEAENGQAALTAFATNPPNLMLMDLRLPDMDGVHVARWVRQQFGIPVVLLSASAELDQIARESGASGYLAKPFKLAELMQMVQAFLAPVSSEGSP